MVNNAPYAQEQEDVAAATRLCSVGLCTGPYVGGLHSFCRKPSISIALPTTLPNPAGQLRGEGAARQVRPRVRRVRALHQEVHPLGAVSSRQG